MTDYPQLIDLGDEDVGAQGDEDDGVAEAQQDDDANDGHDESKQSDESDSEDENAGRQDAEDDVGQEAGDADESTDENADGQEAGDADESKDKETDKQEAHGHRYMTRSRARESSNSGKAVANVDCESVNTVFEREPKSIKQAMQSKDQEQWMNAAKDEIQSLEENHTYDIVDRPENVRVIDCGWVFKVKQDENGNIERYKARLVARGNQQVQGIDYNEVFAPVVKYTALRVIIAIAAVMGWAMKQLDVDTAFLNGDVEEEIYMTLPPGFYTEERKKKKVCRLRKSLYGLKQAPRQWNQKLHETLLEYGFVRLASEHCVYALFDQDGKVILAVYVDDLLITGKPDLIAKFQAWLETKFKLKLLGDARYLLGMRLQRTKTGVLVDQELYIEDCIERYNFENLKCKKIPMVTNTVLKPWKEGSSNAYDGSWNYRSLVGSLMYGMLGTRPDVCYAVSQVSKYLDHPTNEHAKAVKQVYQYLADTKDLGLWYRYEGREEDDQKTRKESLVLTVYSDASYAAECNRRSTTGYVVMLGGAPVSWKSTQQKNVTLSSTEAEYVAAATTVKEVIWIRSFLKELGFEQKGPTKVYEDNQGAIAIGNNPAHHQRCKHIDVKYHFLREKVADGMIELVYTKTEDMLADQMTKAIARPQFQRLNKMMGMRTPLEILNEEDSNRKQKGKELSRVGTSTC